MSRPARVERGIGGGIVRGFGFDGGLDPVCTNRTGSVEGGSCDEACGEEEVLDFPSIGGVEDFVEGVASPEVEHVARIGELGSRAGDPRVVPHGGSEGGADIGEVELRVGAWLDGGDDRRRGWGRAAAVRGVLSRDRAHDESFEE